MRLRNLTDILSPSDVTVVVEDSRTGERVLGETLEKLSGFRYEELLRHEINNFYIVKRTLYVQMKNPPEIRQPRELPQVYLPAPLDQYLVEHGISPNLIKVRDGVLYVYAFKEVETEVRRWMQDKYHRSDLPIIVALDPETGLPMIRVNFYE